VNIFAALSRWVFPPEQQPPSSKLLDDALAAEIARLLAKAEPNRRGKITVIKGDR
jgi:hypothetical protein